MNTPKTHISYLLFSVFCFAAILWIFYDFFTAREKTETTALTGITSEYGVSELADSALKVKIITPKAGFASEAESPFRIFGARPVVNAANKIIAEHPPVNPQRLRLNLKGLMKNPPLAIIEDAHGETHIKAQGDYVQNAQIIAIGNSSVILKDSSGTTHELAVEESK